MKFMNRLLMAAFMVIIPLTAHCGVVWEENFDSIPDWSQKYLPQSAGDPRVCMAEQPNSAQCVTYGPPPGGNFSKFYGWYMAKIQTGMPLSENGMRVDTTNYRGAGGKALTTYDVHYGGWYGGGQLGVHLPDYEGYPEIYIRYWIKWQPTYNWGPSLNTMQKIGHISHYVHNGLPFSYFSTGGAFPTETLQLNRFNNGAGGSTDIEMQIQIRGSTPETFALVQPDQTAILGRFNNQANLAAYLDMDGDALPQGNYQGAGTDYDNTLNGKWNCFEFYLKNNSAPGATDGVYKFFFNGKLLAHKDTVMWREPTSPRGDKIWNFFTINGNSLFNHNPVSLEWEFWRAYDDVVAYTPITPADPQWAASPQDGRLPLDYVIAPGATPDSTPPVTTAIPAGGNYTGTQTVTLSASEAATIYYTTNGSTPTTASAAYTGPLTISSSTILKYFARDVTGNIEAVKTATYAIIDTPAPSATPRIKGDLRGFLR